MTERVIRIKDEEREKLVVKFRSPSLPYEEIAGMIREGYDVFISSVTARTVYYAKRRLSELVGKDVNAWPATFDRTPGYLFSTRGPQEIVGRRKIAHY
jgi:hypothetical protein